MQHLEKETLGNYLSGDLPEQDLRSCERHLVDCNDCRSQLAFLVRILDENLSSEEMAIIESIESARVHLDRAPVSAPSLYERIWRWMAPVWKPAAVTAGVILIAGATWTFFLKNNSAGIPRTLEARLSGQPYSEFVRTRTGAPANPAAPGDDKLNGLNLKPHELGRFYLQHDDFAKAITQLEDAERKQPDSAEIRNDLGVAYMESGRDDASAQALVEFQRALQLNPRYEPALFNLALAYERLGRFSEAEQQLNRYLQMDSSSDWAKEAKSKLQLSKH